MKVSPSMLSCDFSNMQREIERITKAGADYVHLDVMDGNFVPNITFGAPIIKAIRKYSDLPFDVHLMIDAPHRYIEDFAKSGADIITFHIEAEKDVEGTIKKIKKLGVKAGLSVKPSTPVEKVFPYLKDLDLVLVMTVEPGFGGQSFMEDMMEKVKKVKSEIKKEGLKTEIEVDGGINDKTAKISSDAGADVCVAGTSVFKSLDICKAINNLKKA